MVISDKFGRKWKNRDILWIRVAKCSRKATYRWVTYNNERKLIYDKLNGYFDKKGNDVRNTFVELVPVLKGKKEGTWDPFPNTEEATCFKKSITINGYVNQDINKIEFDKELGNDIVIVK